MSGINGDGISDSEDESDDNEEFDVDDDFTKITSDEESEFGENLLTQGNATTKNKSESLSENINLFQSIHVLQSKDNDDEEYDRKDTTAGNFRDSSVMRSK